MMNRTRIVLTVAAVAALLGAGGASAAVVNPVVDFGSGYAMEGSRTVDDHTSDPNAQLLIVGHVVQFNAPFDDLDPNDPTVEYTYVFHGLFSQGTVQSGAGSFLFYDTNYSGGFVEVWADPSMDADFANPVTFMNGTLLLSGSLANFKLSTRSFNCAGNQNADVTFFGGTLASRLAGFTCAINTGLFSVCSGQVPAAQQAQGYFGLSDTKIDVDCPVPTENSTWGGIKRQY